MNLLKPAYYIFVVGILIVILANTVMIGYELEDIRQAQATTNKTNYFIISENQTVNETGSKTYNAPLSCETNSMGLTITCGMMDVYSDVRPNETLHVGRIYSYKTEEFMNINCERNTQFGCGTYDHIIHRLVACLDDDCNRTVFKGDNNPTAEIVNRDRIDRKTIALQYTNKQRIP